MRNFINLITEGALEPVNSNRELRNKEGTTTEPALNPDYWDLGNKRRTAYAVAEVYSAIEQGQSFDDAVHAVAIDHNLLPSDLQDHVVEDYEQIAHMDWGIPEAIRFAMQKRLG